MRYEDSERASIAVRMSLEAFINAARGSFNDQPIFKEINLSTPEDFNVCTNNFMPALKTGTNFILSLQPIFMKTPIPGLSEGLGEFPRFRAELGLESKKRFLDIINELEQKGAQGIVLGCTEIPLLIKQADTHLPIFNTLEIHAKAAVDFAVKD